MSETYKIENGIIKKEIEISESNFKEEYNHLKERKEQLQNEILNLQNEIDSLNIKTNTLKDIIDELELQEQKA
jgi:peptidoglycan hydrolase CwlO-like protein